MALPNIKLTGFTCLLLYACRHTPAEQAALPTDYPPEIGRIIYSRCATSGCHNQQSFSNAAGLNLSSWQQMFRGGTSGSVVIPFRPDFSSLCYFINTDSALGITMEPVMPLNQAPLAKDEYLLIRDWIIRGAPNASGTIPFSGDDNREKIYVTNRMCDVVTVFDAASLLPMRYVDVGVKPDQEFPCAVQVSPDRKHWYVSFFSATGLIQKFDASNDVLAGTLNLPEGSWTSFVITSDSRFGYFVDNSDPGRIAYADLEKMELVHLYTFREQLRYPRGAVLDEAAKKFYTGTSYGNFIYRISLTDSEQNALSEVPVDGSSTVVYHSTLNPIDLRLDPLSGNCLVACEHSGDIRMVNTASGQVVAVISLDTPPAFMALDDQQQMLFISCPDDVISFPGNRGSVKVVDLAGQAVVKTLNTGYQPYGLAIQEKKQLVAVANANISSKGPSSHHVSRCGTKNGNMTFIDLKTLNVVPRKKIELAVYPFGVASR